MAQVDNQAPVQLGVQCELAGAKCRATLIQKTFPIGSIEYHWWHLANAEEELFFYKILFISRENQKPTAVTQNLSDKVFNELIKKGDFKLVKKTKLVEQLEENEFIAGVNVGVRDKTNSIVYL